MLIRVIIENFLSFNERKEFNMLPNTRYLKKDKHKYNVHGIDVLKLSAIYGANAAGKSNFIKALSLLEDIVLEEIIPSTISTKKFKLASKTNDKPITIAVEFIGKSKPFIYAIQVQDGLILTEELYISGLGKKVDLLVFERKYVDQILQLKFFEKFYEEKENVLLLDILKKTAIKKNKTILKLLSSLDYDVFRDVVDAFFWFNELIYIISPESNANGLAHFIDVNKSSYDFAKRAMCSYHVGINNLIIEKKGIREFFGKDDDQIVEDILKKLDQSEDGMISYRSEGGNEIVIVQENDKIIVKQIKFIHNGLESNSDFNVDEESDGTKRLLDFIPAFEGAVNTNATYIIDEIERSIHPLIIKELVEKFSKDNNSKGQLIFTTHESNLLDQKIFRMDEIWFAEKDLLGATDLYSLSKFKEHHTIDIQKGYLNGRYGGIPFLGNLQDLNWHTI